LAWRASITHEVNFCIEAVRERHAQHKKPNIFYTDQGGGFTSITFAQVLKDTNIAISVDGEEASRDDVLSKG
jgi:putative transposase